MVDRPISPRSLLWAVIISGKRGVALFQTTQGGFPLGVGKIVKIGSKLTILMWHPFFFGKIICWVGNFGQWADLFTDVHLPIQ